jgi:sucrose phosphorylase
LVERIHAITPTAASGAAACKLDLYQVNSMFYDALGEDDRAYLLARAPRPAVTSSAITTSQAGSATSCSARSCAS